MIDKYSCSRIVSEAALGSNRTNRESSLLSDAVKRSFLTLTGTHTGTKLLDQEWNFLRRGSITSTLKDCGSLIKIDLGKNFLKQPSWDEV